MPLRRRHRGCMEKRREVGVPAKRQSTVRGHEALLGLARTENVDPGVWSAGAGVDEEPVALLHGEREVSEESLLRVVQTRACPADRCLRLRHHPLARVCYGSIVISANHHRAGLDHAGDAIDDPVRIRAVAHEVAEKDVAVDLGALGVGKAGGQGLAVGMDVGEEGDQHDDPGASADGPAARPPLHSPADRRSQKCRASTKQYNDQIGDAESDDAAGGAQQQDALKSSHCALLGKLASIRLKRGCAPAINCFPETAGAGATFAPVPLFGSSDVRHTTV